MKGTKYMAETMDISNADEETKRFIDFINSGKRTALSLPLLCLGIMMVEMVIDGFANIFTLIIGTFIFTSVIHIYVLFCLNLYRTDYSNVLSAINNNMTIKEWENVTPDQVTEKALKVAKLNWRSLVKGYMILGFSYFMCIAILIITII